MNFKFVEGGLGARTSARQERVLKGDALQIAHLALQIENWNVGAWRANPVKSHYSQDLQCDFWDLETLHSSNTYLTAFASFRRRGDVNDPSYASRVLRLFADIYAYLRFAAKKRVFGCARATPAR